MLEFPEWLTIPLADWIEVIMDWVQATFGGFFDVISDLVLNGVYGTMALHFDITSFYWYWRVPAAGWAFVIMALAIILIVAVAFVAWRMTHKKKLVSMITMALAVFVYSLLFGLLGIERFLLWLPWWLVIATVGFAAWRIIHSWRAGIVMASFMLIIGCFRYGSIGYWDLAMETLAIIVTSVIISLVIGIPAGILMSRNERVESFIKPILDAMQTMPSFVYLIPVMLLFSLGKVPATFATIIYAVPPVIRLTNTGIRQVPKNVIEAAQSFGSNAWQTLLEVELPLATPSILVGINQTTMMALAMVVIASMVGAGGLGLEVLIAINRIEVGRGFQAGLSVVLLAIIIDRITHAMAARQEHTSLKS